MDYVGPVAAFAVFVAIFWWQARSQGMTMRERFEARGSSTGPPPRGWWWPMAALVTVMVAAFLVYVTIEHGWRWQYLWVIPLFGGFTAIGLVVIGWIARRRAG